MSPAPPCCYPKSRSLVSRSIKAHDSSMSIWLVGQMAVHQTSSYVCAHATQVTRAKDEPETSTPPALHNRFQPSGMPRAPAAPTAAPTFQVGDPTPGRIGQTAPRPSQAALPTPQPSPFDAIAELQQALAQPAKDPFAGAQAPQNSAVDPFSTRQAPSQQAADPFAASSLYGGPGPGYTGATCWPRASGTSRSSHSACMCKHIEH